MLLRYKPWMKDQKILWQNEEKPTNEHIIDAFEKYIATPEGQKNIPEWERDMARIEANDIDPHSLRNELEEDSNQPDLAYLTNRFKEQEEEKNITWDSDHNWHEDRNMLSEEQLNENTKFVKQHAAEGAKFTNRPDLPEKAELLNIEQRLAYTTKNKC